MKTAVCMKYVPIIARIQFDYEAKTIIRDGVPSEVNPFDLLGLVRAVEMKRSSEDEVVVINLSPPDHSTIGHLRHHRRDLERSTGCQGDGGGPEDRWREVDGRTPGLGGL